MYTDVFLFIIAFSVFSLYMPGPEPAYTSLQALLCGLLVTALLCLYCRAVFRRCITGRHSASRHAAALTAAKAGALCSYAVLIMVFDVKQAFPKLFLRSECLLNLYGAAVFMTLLLVVWLTSLRSYRASCDPRIAPLEYVLWHARMSCSLIMPWLLFAAFLDALSLLPESIAWPVRGDPAVFTAVLSALIIVTGIFSPWFIVRLWSCSALPRGAERERIERACRSAGVRCSGIYWWNMFGGRMLSAGVLGFTSAFRYLLISPALLELLDTEELDAVIAHEAAHVRYRHMLFYLVFILGFGFLCAAFSGVFFSVLHTRDMFLDLMLRPDGTFGPLYNVFTLTVVSGFLLLYFRVLFGFVSRAFERQADCAALQSTGSARGITGALEKIALEGSAGRSTPSWHHHSIAERCAFARACEHDTGSIVRHGRRVRAIVWGYCALLCALCALVCVFRNGMKEFEERNTRVFVEKLSQRQPYDAVLHFQLAGLYYEKKLFSSAEKEYRWALELRPDFYEAINNLAWMYATCEDPARCDYPEALRLARMAVSLSPQTYILDTLAECLYVNGLYRQAVIAAEEALSAAEPEHRAHYEKQLGKFRAALGTRVRPPSHIEGSSIAL